MVAIRRAVSLAETVVAVFLLVSVFAIMVQLFHSSIRYQRWAERRVQAATVLRSKLTEIRAWSHLTGGSGYNFDDWSTYDGVTVTDSNFGRFQVRTRVADAIVRSPSNSFEATETDPKLLDESLKKVQVEVSWDDGRGSQTISGVTWVADPVREWATPPMTINPNAPTPLNPGDSVDFTVQATDSDGNPIRDAMFTWFVEAVDGRGTMTLLSRDGTSARLTHQVLLPGGLTSTAPGVCRVGVRAVIWGKEEVVYTQPIDLL